MYTHIFIYSLHICKKVRKRKSAYFRIQQCRARERKSVCTRGSSVAGDLHCTYKMKMATTRNWVNSNPMVWITDRRCRHMTLCGTWKLKIETARKRISMYSNPHIYWRQMQRRFRLWGGYGQQDRLNDRSLLQNIVSFIGLFCKRDL